MQFRSYLITALMKYIQNENITQKEAAKRLGVSQLRISKLVHFRIDLFSTDMLLDMLKRPLMAFLTMLPMVVCVGRFNVGVEACRNPWCNRSCLANYRSRSVCLQRAAKCG